jgi:hypothetical protein
LARQARQVLANPRQRRRALRRHQRLERTFHRRYARGMARPHPQAGRYGTGPASRTYAAPYTAAGAPAYAAASAYRPGPGYAAAGPQPRYGTCTCPPCPSCAGAAAAQARVAAAPPVTPTPSFTPSPAYCRACGQHLR